MGGSVGDLLLGIHDIGGSVFESGKDDNRLRRVRAMGGAAATRFVDGIERIEGVA
jgi:hypothetical protein